MSTEKVVDCSLMTQRSGFRRCFLVMKYRLGLSRQGHRAWVNRLLLVFVLNLLLAIASMLVGAGYISVQDSMALLWSWVTALGNEQSLVNVSPTVSVVMETIRWPRTLAAMLAGGSLGLAGALMQRITRNPIAEPGLLGINAGAALGVVAAIVFFSAEAGLSYMVGALVGALAGNMVIVIASHRVQTSLSPLRLVLVGIAVNATGQGLTAMLLLTKQTVFDQFRFWILGSLAGIDLARVLAVLPFTVIGMTVALLLVRPLAALQLGDVSAMALGHHPSRIRLGLSVVIALLAGSAVALTGPIAFLGLLAPFLARLLVRESTQGLLLMAFGLGSALLLAMDILGRWVMQPFETPVGSMLVAVGAPLLIWLVRSQRLQPMGSGGGR
ncbi:FecCD family ABC transporter permease [Zooshikella harenae]|uniref:Iron ABC transporter permease n=1 Tax=Zooshikella harenae TaxID=2827238 RepID=A0ABS5ZBI8_9GAMM|nr:iron ABC transporter permease [Zooshikella harenae]MBU2711123.1 iron ABC transporter permease [Zooshikella harenae]